jgi:hypothetical protein
MVYIMDNLGKNLASVLTTSANCNSDSGTLGGWLVLYAADGRCFVAGGCLLAANDTGSPQVVACLPQVVAACLLQVALEEGVEGGEDREAGGMLIGSAGLPR